MMYYDDINNYIPVDEQEESDLNIIKNFINDFKDFSLDRNNLYGHLTSSAWVINKDATKVLLNYHNIYKNWGWLGGHADNIPDLLEVSLKEVREESGIKNITPVLKQPISVEILPVPYHFKNNKFVSSHLHYNLTYLIVADEHETLVIKPDENSGLKWVDIDDVIDSVNEECMKPIYKKLNNFVKKYYGKN